MMRIGFVIFTLKKLTKILTNYLQTVLPSLIGPEQSCTVKDRTIQYSLHLVSTIIAKVGNQFKSVQDF